MKETNQGIEATSEPKAGISNKISSHPYLAGGALLVGAGLAYAAAKIIRNASEEDGVARGVHLETSVTVNKSPAELYAFWRDFKNLPLFMRNLESVTTLPDNRTHWVAKGPGDSKVEWDAQIINEKENELIAWRSVEPADISNAGSVRFQQAPAGRGTYVRVNMNYNNPAGVVGVKLSQFLGSEPGQLIREDLRRLKQLAEAGEVATIEGQTSGRAAAAHPVSHELAKLRAATA